MLLEGGGAANGALLRAGLVDELSLVIAPAAAALGWVICSPGPESGGNS